MTNLGTMCSTHKIRTRNKTVLSDQFGNNMFHSQIGTRNKTVPNDQFGNNVFHAQIRTRNKTVLIYQFENTMFHSQLGTRNEMFLFYTRVNVLCLSCEKAGPLIINRNTKTRNSRYQRNVPFQISEQPTKLKISEKMRQRLKEKPRRL